MTFSGVQPPPATTRTVLPPRNRAGAGKPAPQTQRSLFCRCGAPLPTLAGLCAPCYSRERHSARAYGGKREQALDQDRWQCRACGDAHVLHVHHRRPGDHRSLVTVCAACHARIHRTRALRRWMPELLLTLWREWHPETPEQLQPALAAPASPSPAPGFAPR